MKMKQSQKRNGFMKRSRELNKYKINARVGEKKKYKREITKDNAT